MNTMFIIGAIVGLAVILVWWLLSMYRVVPPSEAHMIVRAGQRAVRSTDKGISVDGKGSYFKFPLWIPNLGTHVRIVPLTTMEILIDQEAVEKGQARYLLISSTKFRVTNVNTAAERFTSFEELKKQLEEIIKAGVRTVAVKYDIIDARAKKKEIAEAINIEIKDDFEAYGVQLVNFQLVDFKDTKDSQAVSNISLIKEKELEANRRQQNADREKASKIKEASSDEEAKKREIERDQKVGEYQQQKMKAIAEKEKEAQEAAFEVIKVQTVNQAKIEKEKALVLANQQKEVESINKEKKQLIGEGTKLQQEQEAIGAAAKYKEDGLAQAAAKEALQAALNKFEDKAIRALVAEQLVTAWKEVGVAGAKALEKADVRIMSGGDQTAFDTSKMIESVRNGSPETAMAVINKIARGLDLGQVGLVESLGINTQAQKENNKTTEITAKAEIEKAEALKAKAEAIKAKSEAEIAKAGGRPAN